MLLIVLCLALTLASHAAGNTCSAPDKYSYEASTGLYYKVGESEILHFQAKRDCEADGATLPIFKTKDQFELLKDLAQRHGDLWVFLLNPNSEVFFTFHKTLFEGKLFWGDDNSALVVHPWMEDFRVNSGTNCLRIVQSGIVDDLPCTDIAMPVCQFTCPTTCSQPEQTGIHVNYTKAWQGVTFPTSSNIR